MMDEGCTNPNGNIDEKLQRLLEETSKLLQIAQMRERRLQSPDEEQSPPS